MSGPSYIPPGGRALEDVEREALMAEAEAIVETSHLFKSLDDEGRRALIRDGYVLSVPAGETLMEQGDDGADAAMYLVLSGTVLVETQKGTSSSVQLAKLGRGACLGEVSALSGAPRTATVRAMENVQVVAFEQHRVRRLIERYPKVGALLEALVEGRARHTVEKLIGD